MDRHISMWTDRQECRWTDGSIDKQRSMDGQTGMWMDDSCIDTD